MTASIPSPATDATRARPRRRSDQDVPSALDEPGPLVGSVVAAAIEGRPALDSLLADLWDRPRPLIEPDPERPGWSIVTFVWRGRRCDHAEADDDVHVLINRLTQRDDLAACRLDHVPGTDLWWRSWSMRDDWLATYHLAPRRRPEGLPVDVDASRRGTAAGPWRVPGSGRGQDTDGAVAFATVDPGNPRTLPSRWGGPPMSVVALPLAPSDDAWEDDHDGDRLPLGTGTVPGPDGAPRRLWWSDPPADADDVDLLVVLDGQDWGPLYGLADAVDRLSRRGATRPTALVFVDAVDDETRRREYTADPTVADWLADDVVSWARGRWPIGRRAGVGVVGQSLGGLQALHLGDRRPDVIGSVIVQSPSLWWPSGTPFDEGAGQVIRDLADHGDQGVHIDLAVGLQDAVLLPWVRHLRDVLVAGRHSVITTEYDGGHDVLWWRLAITAALRRRAAS